MAEPNTTAAAVITATAAVPAGMILGVHADALLLALFCAICSVVWMESIDTRRKAFCAVLLSAVLGALGSPAASNLAVSTFPSTAPSADALRMLAAAVIGILAPTLVPVLARSAVKKAEKVGEA